jgi:hypothetical protein
MTRESWHDGTYSHAWGSSPIAGATLGMLGVQQTAKAFEAVTLRPKLGNLSFAEGRVPSIKGFLFVRAEPSKLEFSVPCGVKATVCVPRASGGGARGAAAARAGLGEVGFSSRTHMLLLDGARVTSFDSDSKHLCAAVPVGCKAKDAVRSLRAVPKDD